MSFLASVGVTNVDLMYGRHAARAAGGRGDLFAGFPRAARRRCTGYGSKRRRLGIPTRLATYLRQRSVFPALPARSFEQNSVSPYNLAAEGETGIPVNVTSAMLTPGDRTFATYCKPTRHHGRAARAGIYHV